MKSLAALFQLDKGGIFPRCIFNRCLLIAVCISFLIACSSAIPATNTNNSAIVLTNSTYPTSIPLTPTITVQTLPTSTSTPDPSSTVTPTATILPSPTPTPPWPLSLVPFAEANVGKITLQNHISVSGPSSYITAIALSPDASILVVATSGFQGSWFDGPYLLRIWNLQDLTLIKEITEVKARIGEIEFLPDGTKFATISQDGIFRIWDAIQGEALKSIPGIAEGGSFSISLDGNRLAIGGYQKQLILIDLMNPENRLELPYNVWKTAFLQDDRLVAGLAWEGKRINKFQIIRIGDGTLVDEIKPQGASDLYGFSFTSDGGTVALSEQVIYLDPKVGERAVENIGFYRILDGTSIGSIDHIPCLFISGITYSKTGDLIIPLVRQKDPAKVGFYRATDNRLIIDIDVQDALKNSGWAIQGSNRAISDMLVSQSGSLLVMTINTNAGKNCEILFWGISPKSRN